MALQFGPDVTSSFCEKNGLGKSVAQSGKLMIFLYIRYDYKKPRG